MKLAIRAELLDFTDTPSWGSPTLHGVRYRPDHWLLVGADGRIQGAQTDDPGPDWQRHDHRGRLLLPGFIDSHLHAPQLDVIGSWGATLLDWLQDYTFPAEMRHADPAVSQAGAAQFLDALLAHGTTAAVVFPTVHKSSADALFECRQHGRHACRCRQGSDGPQRAAGAVRQQRQQQQQQRRRGRR